MSLIRPLTIFLAITLALSSCEKNPNQQPPEDSPTVMYFDLFADNGQYATSRLIQSERVAYDITNKTLLWKKKNDQQMVPYFWYTGDGATYINNFVTESGIVRIFPLGRSQDEIPVYGFTAEGIYFEKIDKKSGAVLASKIIVPKGDLVEKKWYIMSNVVAANNGFYFACNNGKVYNCDVNGNIVWSSQRYPLISTPLYHDFAQKLEAGYIQYYDGKIFSAFRETVTGLDMSFPDCIDANTGEYLWHDQPLPPVVLDGISGNLILSKKYFADLNEDYGDAWLYNMSNGVYSGKKHTDGVKTGIKARKIGNINDTHFAFFNTDKNIKLISFETPERPGINIDIEGTANLFDESYILQGTKLYAIIISNTFPYYELICIELDPEKKGVLWKQPIYRSGKILSYTIFDNKLYLIADFLPEPFPNTQFIDPEIALSIFDTNNGQIIDRIYPITSFNPDKLTWHAYNFAIE